MSIESVIVSDKIEEILTDWDPASKGQFIPREYEAVSWAVLDELNPKDDVKSIEKKVRNKIKEFYSIGRIKKEELSNVAQKIYSVIADELH